MQEGRGRRTRRSGPGEKLWLRRRLLPRRPAEAEEADRRRNAAVEAIELGANPNWSFKSAAGRNCTELGEYALGARERRRGGERELGIVRERFQIKAERESMEVGPEPSTAES